MLVNQKIQPLGLDIGQSSVKIVQMALAGDRIRVLAAGRAPVDPGLACGSPERRKALALAVKQVLAEGDFHGRNVISALPFDQLKMTSLRLPEAESEEADESIRREAAERFGLDVKKDAINYIFAGTVHQGDEQKNEYILLAADSAAIAGHIAVLEEMGLTPVGIDAVPCALFRTFERMMRRQEDKEKTIIVLDVGRRYTVVVFGRAGEISFAKPVPIGMGHFSEEIASTLGIAAADAELLRRKLQRDEPIEAATRCHIIDALNRGAEQLAGEVSLCLRYYTVTFRGKRVERAFIAGGGAYDRVLRDVLRRHLSVEMEIAEPLRGFDIDDEKMQRDLEDSSADLALAVGLSLRQSNVSTWAEAEPAERPVPVVEGESP